MPQPDSSYAREVTLRMVQVMKAIMQTNPKVTSKKDFASEIEIFPSVISRWVARKSNCTLEDVAKCCNRFRVNPVFLILGTGEMFLQKTVASKVQAEHQIAELSIRLSEIETQLKAIKRNKFATKKK